MIWSRRRLHRLAKSMVLKVSQRMSLTLSRSVASLLLAFGGANLGCSRSVPAVQSGGNKVSVTAVGANLKDDRVLIAATIMNRSEGPI